METDTSVTTHQNFLLDRTLKNRKVGVLHFEIQGHKNLALTVGA